MAASWGVKHVLFFNHRAYKSSSRQIGERFLTTFAKLKVVSPTAKAKLAIDSASLESLVLNREIFIPHREIGRLSLLDQKPGDLPPNREAWKLCGYLICEQNILNIDTTLLLEQYCSQHFIFHPSVASVADFRLIHPPGGDTDLADDEIWSILRRVFR